MQDANWCTVKIVLRDPPLPLLVMAIILKLPMSKTGASKDQEPLPSIDGAESPVVLKESRPKRHWSKQQWLPPRASAGGD